MPSSNNVRKVTSENYPTEIGYEGDFVYETHRYTQNMPDDLMPAALRFSVEVGNYVMALANHKK